MLLCSTSFPLPPIAALGHSCQQTLDVVGEHLDPFLTGSYLTRSTLLHSSSLLTAQLSSGEVKVSPSLPSYPPLLAHPTLLPI